MANLYCYLWGLFIVLLNDIKFVNSRNCSVNEEDLKEFQLKILHLHNIIRAKHEDTFPLCWSNKLAEDAQIWADKLAENPEGVIKPSHNMVMSTSSNYPDYNSAPIIRYGENIFRSNIIGAVSPASAADHSARTWYSQEHSYNYNFGTAGYSDKTKEFTQLVWVATKKVGCGYSVRDPLFYLVVCEYTPTGNVGSKSVYFENVRQKITCETPSVAYGKPSKNGPFYLKQHIDIECNLGFTLEGSRTMECKRDKSWFFKEHPRCTGCAVPSIEFGTVDQEVGSVVPNGEWIKYSCNPGYSLDDAVRVIGCSGNDLTHTVPRCRKEQHCLRPVIVHGVATTPRDDDYGFNEVWDNNIPEGESITIFCKQGYEVVGNASAVCRIESFGPIGSCNMLSIFNPCMCCVSVNAECFVGYIKDTTSVYSLYINVFTGETHHRPPLCFRSDASAVISSTSPLIYHRFLLLLIGVQITLCLTT